MLNPLLDEQVRRNMAGRRHWDRFAEHRRRVTTLLCGDRSQATGRLGVLGAGNCNDLDLATLTSSFAEVHLIDWDEQALAAGVAKQLPAPTPGLHYHGQVELTAVAELLARWTPSSPVADAEVNQLLQQARQAQHPTLPRDCDVAASTCVLTQLVDMVARSLGAHHPRFLEVVCTIRARHLQLLVEQVRPGGEAWLITDFVSSDSCPELFTLADEQLPARVGSWLQQGNFFTGVHPGQVHQFLTCDRQVAPLLDTVEVMPPWRWTLGSRVYAVYALRARRRPAAE